MFDYVVSADVRVLSLLVTGVVLLTYICVVMSVAKNLPFCLGGGTRLGGGLLTPEWPL